MQTQIELSPENGYAQLKEYMGKKGIKNPLLVCGNSFFKLPIAEAFDFSYERFSDFSPNPLYEQCVSGTKLFKENGCDMIIAVGGGSAMDVAKCIRYYSENNVPLIAIPTTAGTGSESTKFAVIYKDGEKLSVDNELCYPDAFILDYTLLENLPENQRKATMLDALSHGIESLWSVNSTKESEELSKKAIDQVLENKEAYLSGIPDGDRGMLCAANLAGKAINITKTTAGHAMCYKLTTLYGIPHGQAAAICIRGLLPFMKENVEKCCDERGSEYLASKLNVLAETFGSKNFSQFILEYDSFIESFGFDIPKPTKIEMDTMINSVNTERLGNHPIEITKEDIRKIYEQIFSS